MRLLGEDTFQFGQEPQLHYLSYMMCQYLLKKVILSAMSVTANTYISAFIVLQTNYKGNFWVFGLEC